MTRQKFIIEIFNEEPEIMVEDLKKILLNNLKIKEIKITNTPFEKDREQRNEEWCKEAFDLVNFSGNWRYLAKKMQHTINCEHRTLIQSFFRMIQQVIQKYAKEDFSNSDSRNEASLKWVKEVSKIEAYLPLI